MSAPIAGAGHSIGSRSCAASRAQKETQQCPTSSPRSAGGIAIPDGFGRSESKQLIAATNREVAAGIVLNTRLSGAAYVTHTAIQHTNPSEADTASRLITVTEVPTRYLGIAPDVRF